MELLKYTVCFPRTLDGRVVHSYGRLIFHERVITDRHELQPPNNDTGDGRIECAVNRGEANFHYIPQTTFIYSKTTLNNDKKAIAVIPTSYFRRFKNTEGYCGSTYRHYYNYLLLSDGEMHRLNK
jgi:hypothetical protein